MPTSTNNWFGDTPPTEQQMQTLRNMQILRNLGMYNSGVSGGWGQGGNPQPAQPPAAPPAPINRGVPQGMGGLLGQPTNAMPTAPWGQYGLGMPYNQMAMNLSQNMPVDPVDYYKNLISPYSKYLG